MTSVKVMIERTPKAGIHRVRLEIAGYTATVSGYFSQEDATRIAGMLKDILEGRPIQSKGKK